MWTIYAVKNFGNTKPLDILCLIKNTICGSKAFMKLSEATQKT